MNQKVLVILSGGLDSTTLAYHVRRQPLYKLVGAVSIRYGQRHGKEMSRARRTCDRLEIPWYYIDLGILRHRLSASCLTDMATPVPEGHYSEESMKATVVPNRNMILLAIAAGVAITHGAGTIVYGAHAGDHAVYPDCRPGFVAATAAALALCDYRPVALWAPFLRMTKAQIVAEGIRLQVPFDETWTCYRGEDKACGRCGTCVERLEAFDIAGATDPLEYSDREFYKTVTSK